MTLTDIRTGTYRIDPVRSAVLGTVLAGGLTGAAYGEMWLAEQAGERLSQWLPGPPALWRLSGHALCVTGVLAGGNALWHRAMTKVEAGSSVVDPVFDDPEGGRHWVEPTVSGSTESLVSWSAMGREGRRHAVLAVRTQSSSSLRKFRSRYSLTSRHVSKS